MFIYVLRNNINGKCYVGQDSGNPLKLTRVEAHRSLLRSYLAGKPLTHESKLIPALAKYGFKNFTVEISSHSHESKGELDAAEIELIAKLNSIRNGYNILPGGQGMPSNSVVTDPEVLASLYEIRSRGARTANSKRWSSATAEDKKRAWESMKTRVNGDWQKNVQASWDRLSVEERNKRGQQMKDGRPLRFVLTTAKEIIVETNLRSLLSRLIDPPVSRKFIEKQVRNENYFECEEFKIEQRQHRND